jgi:spore coat protein U-like protein
MNKLKKLLLISSALILSTANNNFAAIASTASTTITASGTVVGTCSVTASSMVFSTLSQSGTTVITSSVTPTCTNGTGWTITNSGANEGYIFLGSNDNLTGTSRIATPITVSSGGEAFTLANATNGKLTGTGNGSAQAQTGALTATAESASGKVAGVYGGTITLTITY